MKYRKTVDSWFKDVEYLIDHINTEKLKLYTEMYDFLGHIETEEKCKKRIEQLNELIDFIKEDRG